MTNPLNIRRVVLDVDLALKMPSLIEIATAIHECAGVAGLNITVTEIDRETVGTDITIVGEHMDYEELVRAIEGSGAVVHNLDQLVCGEQLVERVPRTR